MIHDINLISTIVKLLTLHTSRFLHSFGIKREVHTFLMYVHDCK
ncbi:hypothetical protein EMIT079MI2_90070 [Bacillus sp. IT-79MI2]